jgi:signal transduction histidine kinase/ActR/RegA family two-component response regulator
VGGDSEGFYEGQARVLERIASGAPLAEALDALVRVIEAQGTGMLCSVLLFDPERSALRHGAAPNLPPPYLRAIDGSRIGPEAGSCGTAAFRREPVIVEDIAADPSWDHYRELALPYGLRSCWSTPIFAASGELLGTFAMYYRDARGPTASERKWVAAATSLASLAITRDREHQALKASEARHRLVATLADETRGLSDAEQILPVALRLLGQHLGASCCAFADVGPDGDLCTIPHDYTNGGVSLVGEHRLSSFGPRLAGELSRGGAPVVVRDVKLEYSAAEGAEVFAALQIRSFICCSLVQGGVCRALMSVTQTTPRAWTPQEVAVVQEFTDRCWATIRERAAQADLRRAEEQLRQAQKMEALGRLAGGVAHDFNNLLSVVLGTSELLLEDLSPRDPHIADIEEIRRAGERASALTRQLLAVSRRQVMEPRVVDLNGIVGGMENMLRRVVNADIELSCDVGPEALPVLADAGQIEQVIMNLVINARDAMPEGGRLTVATGTTELGLPGARSIAALAPGRYATLEVTDTGHGMDAATRSLVFEPFFTTKAEGKGTGLGLSTVYGIVTQSGGYVDVVSAPGAGTTFTIYLPRADGAIEGRAAPAPQPSTLRGSETVLIVEDEDQVRALERAILQRAGYAVLDARNAGEALLAFEQHQGTIDLLVTDVVMPRLGGPALAARLAAKQPGLRVLYVSGSAESALGPRDGIEAGLTYLPKPVTPEALLRKVRETLDDGHRAQA